LSKAKLDREALGVYTRLLRYVRQYWYIFAFTLLAMSAYSASQTAFAALMKPLMNKGFVHQDIHVIRDSAILIVLLFFGRGIASFVVNYSMGWLGRKVVASLRHDLFQKFLDLPARFFDTNATGVLLSKLTYNTEQVSQSTTNSLKVMLNDSLTVLGLLAYMVYLNWFLTVLVFVVVPIIAWLTRYVSRRFRRVSTRIQDSVGELTRTTEEIINGQRIVKLYNAAAAESERFGAANEYNRRENVKMAFTSAAANPLIQLFAGFGLALVIYVLTLQPPGPGRSVGDFTSFLTAVTLLLPALRRVTDVNAAVQRGIAAGHSIFELLDLEGEPSDEGKPLDRVNGDIEFESVSFAYSARKKSALDDVSFHVEPGETLALIGRSGSGKSTLASLIPRFYAPDSGRILIDGNDIAGVRLTDLRRQIAMVTQDVVLFNDTVAHNIGYGVEGNASDEAIREAARAAQILDDVEALPEGFDTMIGEQGALLSGGQRQRIAIARALIKDAPILILDEATSALDSESEHRVQLALEELMRGRTSIVIAHRLSTVEHADRILVLDDGHVVESGTHAELLAKGGMYTNLHQLQVRRTG